jgi:hypothetical protein
MARKAVSDSEHPCEFWQLRATLEIYIRAVALRVECQEAAAFGVERLWSGALKILTNNRRLMKSAICLQWLRVRLNLHLICDEKVLIVKLCTLEKAFDDEHDELMRMEDEDLAKASQATPEVDDSMCTDGVNSGPVRELVEAESDWGSICVLQSNANIWLVVGHFPASIVALEVLIHEL